MDLISLVNWTFVYILTPGVAVLGVLGNSVSLVVLATQGFKKSSNILLFALALSDLAFMLGANSVLKLLYFSGRQEGFVFPEGVARVCYYLYHVFDVLDWGGGTTSMGLPTLITVERMIAVFFPLKFARIVTPRRTLAAVCLVYVFCFGLQFYARAWFQFAYVLDPKLNVSVGLVKRSDLFWQQQAVSDVIEKMYTSTVIPFSVVTAGCLAIGVKVKVASLARKNMTRFSSTSRDRETSRLKSKPMSRTTKTLLSVCVFYSVACFFVSLPAIFPQIKVFPFFSADAPNTTAVFVYNVLQFVLCVNGSVNFVIYVLTNTKFRRTFLQLLRVQEKRKRHISQL
ncbi:galanin-like G-protein coupled receptor npr-9 [Physella acuta]|uniref:galanin-like G-protein coupled receptor npr-9 n=1 Tax=Physella acuta TaxID=109671 RepID=UPI0027DE7EDE|nr:galanin-like G-protein coupled receptor npr-9 [Physella acuta]